jgi:hypothetical protein
MHPEDRDFQRILWRTSPDQPIQEYQLNTVTYGTSSAPFLATSCLNKLADDNQHQQPQAAHAIRNDFYVDDLLSGSNTIEDAMQLRNGITTLLQTAGLTLRKWASNSQQFLDDIPEDSRELQQLLSLEKKDGVSTLGLHWLPKTDQLQVNNSETALSPATINTKRKVLSKVASIFDPLGLISPSVISHKVFLQKLWQDGLQWDQQLSPQLQEEWNQLSKTIPTLSDIHITRKVICNNATNIQLHGFCDSSETAYGACIYIRSTDASNNVFCSLLCLSSRVAPLKKQTIPRLELCAAVQLVKLYKRVTAALSNLTSVAYMWTDSTIVLSWIHSLSNKWKTFVANRIAFIQEETSSATWRHVPSADNPADLISRGIEPTALSTSTLWWNGPSWIVMDISEWPDNQLTTSTYKLELRKVHVALTDLTDDHIRKFSKLNRLLRVTAYCKRFMYNCKQQPHKRVTTSLSTQEIQQALMCCIKLVQHTTYFKELQMLAN